MTGALAGKQVLITGAGRGIGRAIAEAYAAEGASLILTARTTSELEETAKLATAKGAAGVETYSVDLANAAAVDAFAQEVLRKHGHIWGLVLNAGMVGIFGPQAITEASRADMERLLAVNLVAPMHLGSLFIPGMREAKDGLLLFVGSMAGLQASKNLSLYSATKHGLRGYAANLHEILSPVGVKTCYLAPSFVATSMTAPVFKDRDKLIQPSDVAEAALLPVKMSKMALPVEIRIQGPAT